jgi:drug/metabolite transporter (DMT)-like permease
MGAGPTPSGEVQGVGGAPEPGLGIGPLDAIGRHPRLAVLVAAVCIAFSGILYRYADVSPSTGTVFRALFGLPLLALVAILERRRYGPLPGRARRLAAVAGIFFAGDLMFWHHSIEAVGAGLATVLGNLQVLIVGVVAWLVFGERPSRTTMIAVPVVLAGVVLISGAIGQGAYGANPGLGVVLGLLTAVCYSGYLLTIRIGGRDTRRPAGPVAIATVVTALVSGGAGVVGGDLDPTPAAASLGWLFLLGLTSQALGYLMISISLPRLPAIITSIILLVQPVLSVGLGIVLLDERPSAAQLLGVAFVIGGIAIATVPVARLRDGLSARRTATPAE